MGEELLTFTEQDVKLSVGSVYYMGHSVKAFRGSTTTVEDSVEMTALK